MDLDDYLQSISLIDCTGRTTHTLTLLMDGKVKVRIGQVDAFVDPATRTVQPPVIRLAGGEYTHQQVIDLACSFARGE